MIHLDNEMLRGLQMTELELLREADRICRKCGIHYNIIAGTLLGAVRHGGFIPWDDDADIAMLRPEYERFVKACETELDKDRFYFQDIDVTEGYRWGYGKLRMKDTLFLREHQEHMPYEQGVFIDIFPLDCVPENGFLRAVKNFECFAVRKALWAEVGKTADKSALKRLVYRMLAGIPLEKVRGRLHKMIEKARHRETSYVRILTFPTPNRTYAYLKKWYESSAPIKFEGVEFSGIADYDGYLSFKFGEYMSLPPAEQRKTHPVTGFKLPGQEELRENH